MAFRLLSKCPQLSPYIKEQTKPLRHVLFENTQTIFKLASSASAFRVLRHCFALGWIGKNDVVITKKYGPRVRLSAILIDEQFVYGEKILKSNCPENCKKCIDVCPYKALYDVQWNINSLRSDIINYRLCNEKRSLYIKAHGRKSACGLCMAACPFGT